MVWFIWFHVVWYGVVWGMYVVLSRPSQQDDVKRVETERNRGELRSNLHPNLNHSPNPKPEPEPEAEPNYETISVIEIDNDAYYDSVYILCDTT